MAETFREHTEFVRDGDRSMMHGCLTALREAQLRPIME